MECGAMNQTCVVGVDAEAAGSQGSKEPTAEHLTAQAVRSFKANRNGAWRVGSGMVWLTAGPVVMIALRGAAPRAGLVFGLCWTVATALTIAGAIAWARQRRARSQVSRRCGWASL
jgi:hypothetical protein